jgi:hypothetical protein
MSKRWWLPLPAAEPDDEPNESPPVPSATATPKKPRRRMNS